MTTTVKVLAVALSLACFVSFAWAIRSVFKNPEPALPVRMRALVFLGVVFFVAQLGALLEPTGGSYSLRLVGLGLYCSSLGMFWWAVPHARRAALRVAFANQATQTLLVDGPFRFVRHPFYASYVAYWVAGVLVSQHLWLVVSVAVTGLFYLAAIREEEEALLAGPFGDSYRAYRARTGAIVPTLGAFARRR